MKNFNCQVQIGNFFYPVVIKAENKTEVKSILKKNYGLAKTRISTP